MNNDKKTSNSNSVRSQFSKDLNILLDRRTVLLNMGAVGLSACGGGSSTSGESQAVVAVNPTPTPTPTPEKFVPYPGDMTNPVLGTPDLEGWNDVAVATIGDQNALGKGKDGDWTAHAVITRQWHYIRLVDGTQELYNRLDDPFGYINLLASVQGMSNHRDIIATLSAYIPSWNDELYGGSGNDTYIIGGGRTLIDEKDGLAGEVDIIRFPDVTLSQVTLSRQSYSSEEASDSLSIRHPGGEVIVYGHFRDAFRQIEKIECANGVIELSEINSAS